MGIIDDRAPSAAGAYYGQPARASWSSPKTSLDRWTSFRQVGSEQRPRVLEGARPNSGMLRYSGRGTKTTHCTCISGMLMSWKGMLHGQQRVRRALQHGVQHKSSWQQASEAWQQPHCGQAGQIECTANAA